MNKKGLKSGNFFHQVGAEKKTIEVVYFSPTFWYVLSSINKNSSGGKKGVYLVPNEKE